MGHFLESFEHIRASMLKGYDKYEALLELEDQLLRTTTRQPQVLSNEALLILEEMRSDVLQLLFAVSADRA